jgi:hypothetical protein
MIRYFQGDNLHIPETNEESTMAKYMFVYHGGKMPETEADKARIMDAWGSWMSSMGAALIDGGHPVGISITVLPGGRVENNGGANPVSGYSLIEAADNDTAVAYAKKCPILESEGSVEVAECFDM